MMRSTARRTLSMLCCVIFIATAQHVYAEIRLFDTQSFYNQMLDTENSSIGLIPIRHMDNDTLADAAAMRRDATMSTEVRVINALWLLDGHNGSTDRSLGKQMMRDDLESLFNRIMQHQASDNTKGGKPSRQHALLNKDNYRIRVSGDRLLLRFQYGF